MLANLFAMFATFVHSIMEHMKSIKQNKFQWPSTNNMFCFSLGKERQACTERGRSEVHFAVYELSHVVMNECYYTPFSIFKGRFTLTDNMTSLL